MRRRTKTTTATSKDRLTRGPGMPPTTTSRRRPTAAVPTSACTLSRGCSSTPGTPSARSGGARPGPASSQCPRAPSPPACRRCSCSTCGGAAGRCPRRSSCAWAPRRSPARRPWSSGARPTPPSARATATGRTCCTAARTPRSTPRCSPRSTPPMTLGSPAALPRRTTRGSRGLAVRWSRARCHRSRYTGYRPGARAPSPWPTTTAGASSSSPPATARATTRPASAPTRSSCTTPTAAPASRNCTATAASFTRSPGPPTTPCSRAPPPMAPCASGTSPRPTRSRGSPGAAPARATATAPSPRSRSAPGAATATPSWRRRRRSPSTAAPLFRGSALTRHRASAALTTPQAIARRPRRRRCTRGKAGPKLGFCSRSRAESSSCGTRTARRMTTGITWPCATSASCAPATSARATRPR
mmetsp:Transcript_6729/g.19337  ORF Transcript_6729/g.19337 Transcript_6729/m.19337 type:complete len:415 (-) Transcript_6729:1086-2330(-)